MSRIGKKPVSIPAGVTAVVADGRIKVKGPKGELSAAMPDELDITIDDGQVAFKPRQNTKRCRQFWGLQRTLVNNLVTGVTQGFNEVLEITGTGYRAAVQGSNLRLQLGFSHDVNFAIPSGIAIKCPDQTTIEISGIDKQQVGQVAAEIRRWRRPEPYKGKGVRYRGEFIFRKEGKKK
jgi:large subunit ribosomal protein L6